MIKNNTTPLSKESPIRIDAINTIKYTLLFDYHPPEYTDNIDLFFSSLFECCQNCCHRVFKDIPDRRKNESHSIDFFGFPSSESIFSPFFSFSTLPQLSATTEIDIFKPSMFNYIFQHCIISSYHAVQSALENPNGITTYSLFQHTIKDSKTRSSKASNFDKVTNSHLKSLPFIENLVYKNYSSGNYMFSSLFLDCWKDICKIDARKYGFIYNSESSVFERFNHILDIYETLYRCNLSEPKSFHKRYILERTFNFDLFYNTLLICVILDWFSSSQENICKFVDEHQQKFNNTQKQFIERKFEFLSYTFNEHREELLSLLPLSISLPNVFTRKYFILYSLDMITQKTNSNQDYWRELDWNYDVTVVMKENSNEPRNFSFTKWKEQFILYINYFSEHVFPVYEWCFLGMLMESIEKKYISENHTYHLKVALNTLEQFIKANITYFSNPTLSPDFSIKKIFNEVTGKEPYKFKFDNYGAHRLSNYTKSDIPTGILELLIQSIYNKEPDFNLNLSEKLNPNYFRFSTDTSYKCPTLKVRRLYFDILKEYHFNNI